ncbi:MAG: hypothetical protein DHS20C13_06930 [Thermodesulfobacteriota bacterium]|nr:MAG: hypothetical protein DHS20C13_06930 [Thermodesulfobacteriota bacterium]
MARIQNLLTVFVLSLVLFFAYTFSLSPLISFSTFAQDDQYYEDVEENTNLPDYEDPDSYQDFPDNEDQNPDPEFMEEVEPGEYDQSDDVTELNENNY